GSSSVQLRNSGATRWARSLPRLRGRVGVGANSLCSSCEPPPCPSPASGGGDAVASGRRDHRIPVLTATSAIPSRWSWRAPTGDAFARVITGLLILVLWEGIARTYAPPYVARPTGVLAAIPRVMADPAFLEATGITLSAVAWGLLISIVAGTL